MDHDGGFILPFALTFVAIPLETFVHSLRTVLGLLAIGALRATSLVLRLLGNAARYVSVVIAQIYDLPLFIPLWWAARDTDSKDSPNETFRKVMP